MQVTNGTVPADKLIAVIKDSLERADVSPTGDLRLDSVQLILKVVSTATAGGGVNFRVPVLGMQIRFDARTTRQNTHTLDITLKPSAQPTGRELRDGAVEEVLIDAITTIRTVIKSAAQGQDPWVLDASMLDITFGITDQGTISLGFECEFANEVTHTLRLGFATT